MNATDKAFAEAAHEWETRTNEEAIRIIDQHWPEMRDVVGSRLNSSLLRVACDGAGAPKGVLTLLQWVAQVSDPLE